MSALAGAIVALFLFVITQSVLKFVIEPVQDQKKLIGEVAQALSMYANIYDVEAIGLEETRRELRSLSARLWASLWAIPFYDAVARVRLVPKAKDVMVAATHLTVWSHSLKSEYAQMERREAIAQKLGITRRFDLEPKL